MAKVRALRREASALLRVARDALRFLTDSVAPSIERDALITRVTEVIDRADPPEETGDAILTLVMTNPTAGSLIKVLESRATASQIDLELLHAVVDGLRKTRQRSYVKLDLNHTLLQRLHFVLMHSSPTALQVRSFHRLAKDVEQACSRNPLEILGRLGL